MSLLLADMCVFTQQAFPGAIQSLGLQQRGDPIGAYTHTQIYTDSQTPPDEKRGGETESGTEVWRDKAPEGGVER